MSAAWTAVIAGSAACYALKALGLSVPARVLEHPVTTRAAAVLPVALLAALVAVQVLADGGRVVLDARAAALAVAVGLLTLRAPFLVVVVAAAATAALLRAGGVLV